MHSSTRITKLWSRSLAPSTLMTTPIITTMPGLTIRLRRRCQMDLRHTSTGIPSGIQCGKVSHTPPDTTTINDDHRLICKELEHHLNNYDERPWTTQRGKIWTIGHHLRMPQILILFPCPLPNLHSFIKLHPASPRFNSGRRMPSVNSLVQSRLLISMHPHFSMLRLGHHLDTTA